MPDDRDPGDDDADPEVLRQIARVTARAVESILADPRPGRYGRAYLKGALHLAMDCTPAEALAAVDRVLVANPPVRTFPAFLRAARRLVAAGRAFRLASFPPPGDDDDEGDTAEFGPADPAPSPLASKGGTA